MSKNRRSAPPRPDELKLVRNWWCRVYVRVVHKHPLGPGSRMVEIDSLIAADCGAKMSTIRTARSGWDNLSPKLLRKLRQKLGVFLASHPVDVMGKSWPKHLAGTLSLIEGEREARRENDA